ncbi:disease resistance protein RPV1 [Lactuca sativa]|uniref:disease resistance protein RPV1 n=1 Tax=Lactuca sativa TaxID=4236 RepID=UPI000CB6684D|nr:disease resistance protein RPV1 [Lactuca sativa]
MASSSTSSVHRRSSKYDVFLSFRGKDTRKNFVDHLYHALQRQGICTYKDDKRITKGKRICDELISSIKDSKFYIIVFSRNYASSSWCLDELVKIMECHNDKTTENTALPVFYDVAPKEVRHQRGAVRKAFAKHKNKEAAGKWTEALKEAADLAGWELKNTADGHEAKFIQEIVERVSLKLCSINFNFDEKLVGMETRVNDLVSSLEIGIDDVRMIGIKGMGGGGKTTLARSVFDQISFKFEGVSFVENVREVSSTSLSGLKSLQRQILSDVLDDKDISIKDVKNMMKSRMRGIKVLIVLDDVNHLNQLEALAGEPIWFKPGSRIIITTRDEKVLLAHKVTLIRDVNLLSDKEAICLFSRYAFGREIPIEDYEELSEQVLCYASGLPLTIKVLGSNLCGEDKPIWNDTLQRLKTIPLTETMKILELSYTILEDDHKEIFLDIACIMKGWLKENAIQALESCGFHALSGLRVLQQKSLITIDAHWDQEYVGMHDHIEEMGINIVRRSHPNMREKHSRLWKNDVIEHILANDLGTEEIRCIELSSTKLDPYTLIKGLGKMKALRYLSVVTTNHSRDAELDTFIPSFPDALGYLKWDSYPFRSLPETFQANNLVTLELPTSEIVQLWEGGEKKVLDKLRFLDLSDSKLKTIDLDLTPNLETLNLKDCHDLVELSDDIWKLEHLKSLDLWACLSLKNLPEVFQRVGCLENLNLSPDSISIPKNLKYLRLAHCDEFEKLPEDLGCLESLEVLDLTNTKLKHLPDSITLLKHLTILILYHSRYFNKLPEDLSGLESLKDLDLSCTDIEHLPDSICELKHLESLNINVV